MSWRPFSLLLLAAALAGQANASEFLLGEQKFFLDWGVACDNTLSCEAVAFQPESRSERQGLSLTIGRNANDGAVTVMFVGEASKSDRYRLRIDGRLVDSGMMNAAGDGTLTFTGATALKVARALARGTTLRLEDGRGTLLGKTSLRGSFAALRYIDSIQNRAETPQALAIIGRKAARAKAAPAPVITAKRISTTGPTPDATAIVDLVEKSGCAAERDGVTEDSAHSLGTSGGSAKALVIVSCGAGAYNTSSVAYVGTQGANNRWSFQPARFDLDPVPADAQGGPYLINAGWAEETQQLSSYSKARGIGDCGSSKSYVWDGTMFRLVEAFGMEKCRGSLDWLPLWRAKVELVD